ncbi:hypothetical protein A8139_20970 [Marinomonas primoryensis]|uniref:TnsE C-terminal domain-containing protein n=1 Tax=Marinomonas primoryensis TaxID=178399 RepID=A0A2Z4PX87_9GAMM|nr:hypothetical protein [Marinomonas primoryensis]AWY02133.1 hypothetical protein A8139_20970 [Marinomonas primoryensis]
MRSVNYQDNSKVTHIGQLLKGTSSNQWRMNVATYPFMPDNRRTDVFSLLPFFARGRILNQTKLVSTDCSEETFLAPIVDEFKEVTLGVFSELSPDSKYIEELESKQMAFSWNSKMNETDITIILPQLELARVTVLQIPFLCRGCTNSTSLLMNFDCSYDSAVSTFNINVFNNSAFPASTLQSEGVRNILAWMLYDKDAKNSFESINRNLQREKVISGNWECWNFRFDLPNISGWKFKCLGRYSNDKTKYFVDEIIGLEIDSDMPMNIVFKGKDFIENINYEGDNSTISKSSAKQSNRFELDMNAHPNDEWIPHFTDPKFTCSFTRPFTSTVERKQRYISNADRTTREGFSDSASRKASTGETTIKGSDKPVSVGGAREGESNNKSLMDRFKLFSKVVDRLEQNPLVKIHERDIIHSLCKIGKSRLHRLSDPVFFKTVVA